MPKKYDDVNQVKRSKYVFSDRVTKEGRDNNKWACTTCLLTVLINSNPFRGRNKGSNQQSSPAEVCSSL